MVFNFLSPRRKIDLPYPELSRAEEEFIERSKLETPKKSEAKSQVARSKRRILPTSAERFQVGKRVGTFVVAGATLREDFTREQEMLGEMFGQGEHIWGVNNEPVIIHHNLKPRQRGDNGTAELFGFG